MTADPKSISLTLSGEEISFERAPVLDELATHPEVRRNDDAAGGKLEVSLVRRIILETCHILFVLQVRVANPHFP